MTVDRVTIELSGGPGGNGIVTMYFKDGPAGQQAVKSFADHWHNQAPNDVTLNVPNSGATIDQATGDQVGAWTAATAGTTTGTDAGGWIAGSGIRVRWITGDFVAGRKVTGSSFIVPVGAGSFDTSGLPTPTLVNAARIWAAELIAATPGNMVVWSRPKPGRGGTIHDVISGLVPVKGTYLRSRRQ